MKQLLFLLTFLPSIVCAGDLKKDKAIELINSTVQIRMAGSQGTGVVIYSEMDEEDDRVKNTYVITNKHVAKKVGKRGKVKKYVFLKKRLTVGHREYTTRTVFVSKHHDVAIIEIKTPATENFKPVEFCPESSWDRMTLYDKVYLVSCGLGTVPTVTKGNLSSVNAKETSMMFTAQIIYGSSGGGLYNSEGKLIGLGNAIRLTRGHPIPHKALGVPLPAILKDLRESDYKFILGEEEEDEDHWYWEDEDEEEEEDDDDSKEKIPEAPKEKEWF